MKNIENKIKYGLPAVIDKNSRILIVGTFPSELSLTKQQYYANSMNQFWQILFSIFQESFSTDYNKRLQLLTKNRIALWDIIEQCTRDGSSDNKIKNEKPNDFKKLINQYSNITHLLFNGSNPEKYFSKHKLSSYNLKPIPSLPSTSSANTHFTLEEKITRWSSIKYLLIK